MWNNPYTPGFSERGRRFSLADISALALPLDELLEVLTSRPVAEVVDEEILRRLEKVEFVFALYQVLEAMLEDVEVPEAGHTGIQEAMVAELLSQSYSRICVELDEQDFGHSARKAAWISVERLLIRRDPRERGLPGILEDAGLKLSDDDIGAQLYRSEKLTHDVWWELLLGEGGLWSEFLSDADWRTDSLMDVHPGKADAVAQLTGIDLSVIQALPHTPNEAELRMAEHYIRYLIWKDEVANQGTDDD